MPNSNCFKNLFCIIIVQTDKYTLKVTRNEFKSTGKEWGLLKLDARKQCLGKLLKTFKISFHPTQRKMLNRRRGQE